MITYGDFKEQAVKELMNECFGWVSPLEQKKPETTIGFIKRDSSYNNMVRKENKGEE